MSNRGCMRLNCRRILRRKCRMFLQRESWESQSNPTRRLLHRSGRIPICIRMCQDLSSIPVKGRPFRTHHRRLFHSPPNHIHTLLLLGGSWEYQYNQTSMVRLLYNGYSPLHTHRCRDLSSIHFRSRPFRTRHRRLFHSLPNYIHTLFPLGES